MRKYSRNAIGFESLARRQFYLSKALSGCVLGLGPSGPGSNPGRETKHALVFQRLEFRFCSPAMEVRVLPGAPSLRMLTANFYTFDF